MFMIMSNDQKVGKWLIHRFRVYWKYALFSSHIMVTLEILDVQSASGV